MPTMIDRSLKKTDQASQLVGQMAIPLGSHGENGKTPWDGGPLISNPFECPMVGLVTVGTSEFGSLDKHPAMTSRIARSLSPIPLLSS